MKFSVLISVAILLGASSTAMAGVNSPTVIHGIPTHAYPTVSAFTGAITDNGKLAFMRPCTGVEVGPGTMLTAAHCVAAFEKTEHFEVHNSYHLPAVVKRVLVHPKYQSKWASPGRGARTKGQASQRAAFDLAVLLFDPPAFREGFDPNLFQYASVATQKPKWGTPVDMVGYGGRDPKPVKRVGYNRIADANNGTLWLYGISNGFLGLGGTLAPVREPGDLGLLERGDSGGPLFDLDERLVGIASRVWSMTSTMERAMLMLLFNEPFTVTESVYTDVSSEDSRTFLDDARMQGANFKYDYEVR
jgi:hypothetical protein